VDAGRVYFWKGKSSSITTTWDSTATGGQAHARFGYSLSTLGAIRSGTPSFADFIVGSPYYSNGSSLINEGAAFVYNGSSSPSSALSSTQTLESNRDHALFGESVATAGNAGGLSVPDALIGARLYVYDEDGTKQNEHYSRFEGRLSVYQGNGSGLSTISETHDAGLTAVETTNFSHAVSGANNLDKLFGTDVIVGEDRIDVDIDGTSGAERDVGRVLVYLSTGMPAPPSPSHGWDGSSQQSTTGVGSVVAWAGDLNGDGYRDLVVGAPAHNSSRGRVLIYYGSANGFPTSAPSWYYDCNVPRDGFITS